MLTINHDGAGQPSAPSQQGARLSVRDFVERLRVRPASSGRGTFDGRRGCPATNTVRLQGTERKLGGPSLSDSQSAVARSQEATPPPAPRRSMSWECAATLCLFAWCHAGLEAEFFVKDWGVVDGADNGASALAEASKRAFRTWDARLSLSGDRRACGDGHRPRCPRRQKSGVPQERGCPFPGHKGVRASVSLLQHRVVCERNPDPSSTSTPAGGLSK